jgi:hypothetical protein
MTEKTEFLPFHAINEYMRPDFRLKVVRETINAQTTFNERLSNELNQQIKKYVSVPGFRSSDKAPAMVKVIPTSKAFEKYPELVAVILSCWTEIHPELCQQVYTLLKDRNWPQFLENDVLTPTAAIIDAIKEWPVFPITMDRTKLPGFFTHWPKGEDFEALYKTFASQYPDSDASIDKVSLMVVWLSMRLPLHVDDDQQIPDSTQISPPIEE